MGPGHLLQGGPTWTGIQDALSVGWSTFPTMATDLHAALRAPWGDLPADPAMDRAADRAVQVLHAHAAALAWVRQATGTYPALPAVAAHQAEIAAQLRDDDRDPLTTLIAAAATAVTQHQATTAA